MKQNGLSLALGLLLMTTACQAPVISTSTATHSHDNNTDPNHSHSTTNEDEKIDQGFNRAIASNVPSVYSKITYATDISMSSDGNSVIIKTKGRPENHKSDYYKNTPWETALGETDQYTNTNNPATGKKFAKNQGKIIQFGMTFTIPVNTSNTSDVYEKAAAGPMGVTSNGVSIYSPFNVDGTEATDEAVSFDSHGAHPDGLDKYHYHIEPKDLTSGSNSGALVGFMLDGYPVYGPKEANGSTPQGLDNKYYGHYHATSDYPNGVYHYHVGAKVSTTGSGFYYFNSGYYKGNKGAVQYYPDFNAQDWSNQSLSTVNLSGGDFKDGNFTNTVFSKCTLTNANFTNANLTGANFTEATLTNATFKNATWTDGSTICNSSSVGSCTDYEYEPASTNLKLALKMNGNTNDSSGNAKNATAVNSPVLSSDRINQSNKAYTFNGSNYMTVPTVFDSSAIPTEVSVEAWVNPSSSADGDNYIFYSGDNAEFTLVTANNSLRFATRINSATGGNPTWYNAESTTTLPRNSWTHLVGVWKKGVSTKLYINGVLSATTTVPNTNLNDAGTSATSYVGCKYNSGARSGVLSASVDQIKVYNKALSDTEISTMYNTEK